MIVFRWLELNVLVRPQELSQLFKGKAGGGAGKISWQAVILFLGAIFTVFLLVKLYQKYIEYKKYKKDRVHFLALCEEKNLTYHQTKILETLSKKYQVYPSILLSSKKKFIQIVLKESRSILSKHKNSHPVYIDFDTNIKYIRSVFHKKKPGKGQSLQSSRDIHVGTKVIVYKREKQNPHPVKGVISYMDNSSFVVQFQESEVFLKPLLESTKISVFFNHEMDANYDFATKIASMRKVKHGEQELIQLIFVHSEHLRRRQRRKMMRLRVNTPVVISEEIMDDKVIPVTIQGKMLDVSDGGACFLSQQPSQQGVLLKMEFYLDSHRLHSILAKVINTHATSNGFIYHVSFADMPNEVRQKLKLFISRHIRRRL